MFGIGLPEMIVILAVALIVVGPDKLPELAKSLAKGVMEMKQAVNQLKSNLVEEEELNEVQKELRNTADSLKKIVLDPDSYAVLDKDEGVNDVIEADTEELRPWEKDAVAEPVVESEPVLETVALSEKDDDTSQEPTPRDTTPVV